LNLIDLFESNFSKLKAIQDKYFCHGTNNSTNLISSSDWLIPKEKFYTSKIKNMKLLFLADSKDRILKKYEHELFKVILFLNVNQEFRK